MSTSTIPQTAVAPSATTCGSALDVAVLVTPRLVHDADGPRRLAEALAARGVGAMVVRDAEGVGAALDTRSYATDLRSAAAPREVRTVRGPGDIAAAVGADVVVLDEERPAALARTRGLLTEAAGARGGVAPRTWATVVTHAEDAGDALRTARLVASARAAGHGALLVLDRLADLDGLDVALLATATVAVPAPALPGRA